jgi:hypothetical protein
MSGSAGGGSVTLSAAIMNLGPVQHCGMGGGELAVHYDAPPGGYIDPNSVHYGRGGCGECHVSFSGPAEKPTRIEVKVVHTFDLGCQSECAYCDWNGKGVEFVAYVP